jgi:hypothetical protein
VEIRENPNLVAPRAFFAARVSRAGPVPRLAGDDGQRPPAADPPIVDPREQSVAEGLAADRTFSTAGTLDATFDYDRIQVRVSPAQEDRFLVLNERFYPGWRATVDGRPAEVYATNIVMRGLIVPAGATSVELHFVPFLASGAGVGLLVAGLVLTAAAWWGVRYAATRPRPSVIARPPAPAR